MSKRSVHDENQLNIFDFLGEANDQQDAYGSDTLRVEADSDEGGSRPALSGDDQSVGDDGQRSHSAGMSGLPESTRDGADRGAGQRTSGAGQAHSQGDGHGGLSSADDSGDRRAGDGHRGDSAGSSAEHTERVEGESSGHLSGPALLLDSGETVGRPVDTVSPVRDSAADAEGSSGSTAADFDGAPGLRPDHGTGDGRGSGKEEARDEYEDNEVGALDAETLAAVDVSSLTPLARNMHALETLQFLRSNPPTEGLAQWQRDGLECWQSWGALQDVFDITDDRYTAERDRLQKLLTPAEYRAARRTVLTAFYTDEALTQAMWDALTEAGFDGGAVLEPGCGKGTFMSTAPADAHMVGVELDPTSARIAALLHPDAQVRSERLETTPFPNDTFSAVIGNVPFGTNSPYDQIHNSDHLSLHNYAINKSIALTQPGGLVAVITSTSTADADGHRGQAARAAICANADLVTGVRLPSGKDGAFAAGAGTEVGTDILIFRKREDGQEPTYRTTEFLRTTTKTLDGDTLPINEFFATHPEHILGTLHSESGPFGRRLAVRRDATTPLADQVRAALIPDMQRAADIGQGHTADSSVSDELAQQGLVEHDRNAAKPVIGMIRYERTGSKYTFEQLKSKVDSNPQWEPISGSKYAAQWVKLIDLRDTVSELLESNKNGDEKRSAELLAQANEQYDDYVAAHGPINLHETKAPKAKTKAQITKAFNAAAKQWRKDNDLGANADLPPEVEESLLQQAQRPSSPPMEYSPHLEGLKGDPFINLVKSLENYESTTKQATKGALLSGTQRAATLATTANNLHDAIRVLRFAPDGLTAKAAAKMLEGYTAERVEQEFIETGVAFRSHEQPESWIPAQKYLSGNVRRKLDDVEALAEHDPRYAPNVEALREAQPARKTEGITFPLGATWIPTDMYVQFARDTFGIDEHARVYIEHVADQWSVSLPKEWRGHKDAAQRWGVCADNGPGNGPVNFQSNDPTLQELPHHGIAGSGNTSVRFSAADALLHAMNNKAPQLNYSKAAKQALGLNDKLIIRYPEATEQAGRKVAQLAEYFETWVKVDAERHEKLLDIYNDKFNNYVLAEHDGSDLVFEGLNPQIKPYGYQLDAVERIITSPTTLLNHCVGAGKTGTMVLSAMKLKELGLSQKPMIVTPNHLSGQIAVEANQWFPTARVLDGSIGMGGEANVNMVAAQIAAHDWDVIVLPEQVFKSMNMSIEYYRDWTEQQIELLERDLEQMKALEDKGDQVAHGFTVRNIEAIKESLEEQLRRREEKMATAHGVPLDKTGVDTLFVDEAHRFKNLTRVSQNKDLDCKQGSDKATDLAVKSQWLRDMRGKDRPSIIFATGTPYSNNAGELWTLMSYLAPETLEEQDLAGINAWGHHFTQAEMIMGLSPANRIREEQRITEWHNRPALTLQLKLFMDYVPRSALTAALPELVGGGPVPIEVPVSQEVRDHQRDAKWRETQLKGINPKIDNPLSILNDSRMVAVDPRLANLEHDPSTGRIKVVTDRVAEIWEENKNNTYLLPDGSESPKKGALQILFLDSGVPSTDPNKVNLYEAIRQELVSRGMDRDRIAFVHEYDKDKTTLYKMCNEGDVDVIIGNTEKLSTGANIQTRAIALHHLDVPWKSSDFTQRGGRLVRQGNQNKHVYEHVYIAPGTSDAKLWATIKLKASLEEQIFDGNPELATVENPPETALHAAGFEGMSLENPAYQRKLTLEREVGDLQSRKNEHEATRSSYEFQVNSLRQSIPRAKLALRDLDYHAQDVLRWQQEPDQRSWLFSSGPQTDRKTATNEMIDMIHKVAREREDTAVTVGSIGGVRIRARYVEFSESVHVDTQFGQRVGHTEIKAGFLDRERMAQESPTTNLGQMYSGYMSRIENMVTSIPDEAERLRKKIDADERQLTLLESRGALGPFPDEDKLRTLSAELDEVVREVYAWENSPEKQRELLEYQVRSAAKGRMHGWTKALMPTAYMRETGLDAHPNQVPMEYGEYSNAAQTTVIDMEEDDTDAASPSQGNSADAVIPANAAEGEAASTSRAAEEDTAQTHTSTDAEHTSSEEPDLPSGRRAVLDITRSGVHAIELPEGDNSIDAHADADTTPEDDVDRSLCFGTNQRAEPRDEDTTPEDEVDTSLCLGATPSRSSGTGWLVADHLSAQSEYSEQQDAQEDDGATME